MDFGAMQIDDLDMLTIALYLNETETQIELLHIGSNNLTE